MVSLDDAQQILTPDGRIKDKETLAIMRDAEREEKRHLARWQKRLMLLQATLNCARLMSPDNKLLPDAINMVRDIADDLGAGELLK